MRPERVRVLAPLSQRRETSVRSASTHTAFGSRIATVESIDSTGRPSTITATVFALVVTFLWSTSWIMIRWGLDDEDLDPLGFAALRYLLAAAVLVAVVLAKPSHREAVRAIDTRTQWLIVILGIVYFTFTQGAQFIAIDNQPAATTSLVLSATPLIVAMASTRMLAERPSVRQVAGGVLVAGGASLFFAGSLGATAIGLAAAIIGVFANSGGSVLGRRLNRGAHTPAVVITALSMSVGAVGLAVAAIIAEGIPTLTARALVLIVWLAVVNTALANTMWNHSLQGLSAVASAGINNTMLMQIALLAWWFLDEAPGVRGFVAIALVSVGVLMTQLTSAATATPTMRR